MRTMTTTRIRKHGRQTLPPFRMTCTYRRILAVAQCSTVLSPLSPGAPTVSLAAAAAAVALSLLCPWRTHDCLQHTKTHTQMNVPHNSHDRRRFSLPGSACALSLRLRPKAARPPIAKGK